MKRLTKMVATVLVIPAAGVFLLGCPKKATVGEAGPEPRVSESIVATRPGAGGGETTDRGTGAEARPTTSEDQRLAQILASRGEDIPIKEPPAMEFADPDAAERAILRPIYFDYDKSNIRPEFQPVLEGIAQWMAKNPTRQLLIEGHCDERGTDEYNLALGERRALAVRRYLVALGALADHLHTISYGEEKPADPGHEESSWAKNRRSEFKVSAR